MVVVWVVLVLSGVWTLAAWVALARTVRPARAARFDAAAPPLSVLKPLASSEPDLEGNLESFFEQDHPDYEIVFGVHDPADAAIPIVERLCSRYPHVRSRLVVHGAPPRHDNPKVDNLRGMLSHARYDLVVISDSNVRAPSHYLKELARCYASSPRSAAGHAATGIGRGGPVGLVTNLFAGVGERSIGAALDAVQLNGFCAAGATLPSRLGDPLVVGKSMLFSRATLDRIGGLERVANLLAEDFVMGKMFQHAGLSVVIAPTVLQTVTPRLSVREFIARHLRWAMIRWRLRPFAALLEPLTAPLALLPLAIAALGGWALVWVAVLWLLRDGGGWVLLRGPQRLWVPLLLAPVRDAMALAVWAIAPFKRHITWRGCRVRVGAGTLVYVEERLSQA